MPTPPAIRNVRDRRGFLALTVLVLLVITVTMTTFMLNRAATRSAIVQQQIDAYKDHHQLRSIRDIAQRWFERPTNSRRLEQIMTDVRPGDPMPLIYEAELPDGTALAFRIADGQGTLLRHTESATNPVQKRAMARYLEIIPAEEVGRVTRLVGPPLVRLRAAPDRVLEVIAEGDGALLASLIFMRDNGMEGNGEIVRTLASAGFAQETVNLMGNHVFTPTTTLWRLEVEAEHRGIRQRYHLYINRDASGPASRWRILEARLIRASDEEVREEALPGRSA